MLTIGSLFSGIGGLERGLALAGLGPVRWQVERDPYCRAVLERHWPGDPMKKPPKKPARKFVLIEVETKLSNADLSAEVCGAVTRISDYPGGFAAVHVLQVHVNAAKKEPTR